jgi:hypothetical protein
MGVAMPGVVFASVGAPNAILVSSTRWGVIAWYDTLAAEALALGP